MSLRPAAIAALALSLFAIAAQAAITVLPGSDNQTARIGSNFPNPIRIAVTDASGNPAPNVNVLVQVTYPWDAQGVPVVCCLSPDLFTWTTFARTDGNGIATLPLVPSRAGTTQFVVHGVGASITGYGETTLTVNVWPALQALWWGGFSENGWGMSVVQHPGDTASDLPNLFIVLFVYDAQGNPVWYVMPSGSWSAGYSSTWTAPIYKPHGPPFYRYDASLHGIGPPLGELVIDFSARDGASMSYRFFAAMPDAGTSGPSSGSKALTRLDFSNETPSPLDDGEDLWWGGFAQNGWGIAVHQNPGAVFTLWFTYGDDGQPTWFAMSNGSWTKTNTVPFAYTYPFTFSGPIFKPYGSPWVGVPYDASRHREDEVGSFSLGFGSTTLPPGASFTHPAQATFDYTMGARHGVLTLSRVPF